MNLTRINKIVWTLTSYINESVQSLRLTLSILSVLSIKQIALGDGQNERIKSRIRGYAEETAPLSGPSVINERFEGLCLTLNDTRFLASYINKSGWEFNNFTNSIFGIITWKRISTIHYTFIVPIFSHNESLKTENVKHRK